MSDTMDFLPLRKADFADAGEHGLAMRLETQESTDGRVLVLGCFVSAEQGRALVLELAKALDKKYPESRN